METSALNSTGNNSELSVVSKLSMLHMMFCFPSFDVKYPKSYFSLPLFSFGNSPQFSKGTGPEFDHTSQAPHGGYLLFPSKKCGSKGDKSIFFSNQLQPARNGACLVFYYHMRVSLCACAYVCARACARVSVRVCARARACACMVAVYGMRVGDIRVCV